MENEEPYFLPVVDYLTLIYVTHNGLILGP